MKKNKKMLLREVERQVFIIFISILIALGLASLLDPSPTERNRDETARVRLPGV